MTSRRALWEALATICVPSLVIWGVLFYFMKPQAGEWPSFLILFAILFALPLPLFFPIYNRYRKGIKYDGKNTPRHRLTWAMLAAVLSAVYIVEGLHRSHWDRVFHLALAMLWLVGSADHFRRWAKIRAGVPSADIRT